MSIQTDLALAGRVYGPLTDEDKRSLYRNIVIDVRREGFRPESQSDEKNYVFTNQDSYITVVFNGEYEKRLGNQVRLVGFIPGQRRMPAAILYKDGVPWRAVFVDEQDCMSFSTSVIDRIFPKSIQPKDLHATYRALADDLEVIATSTGERPILFDDDTSSGPAHKPSASSKMRTAMTNSRHFLHRNGPSVVRSSSRAPTMYSRFSAVAGSRRLNTFSRALYPMGARGVGFSSAMHTLSSFGSPTGGMFSMTRGVATMVFH